jgi:hypothetical protein
MTNKSIKGANSNSSLSLSIGLIYTGPKLKSSSVEIVKLYEDTECDSPDLSYEISHSENLDESLHISPNTKKPVTKKSSLLPTAKLEDLHDYIPFENVFHVDQNDIDKFNTTNEQNSKDLFDIMLNRHASLNIATEVATAQIEAVMLKCLDSPVDPDIDLPNMLDFVNQLDTLNFFLQRSEIPEQQTNLIVEKAIDKLIGDWQSKTKSSIQTETFRRHREELQNADPDQKSSFAIKRSRSG